MPFYEDIVNNDADSVHNALDSALNMIDLTIFKQCYTMTKCESKTLTRGLASKERAMIVRGGQVK